MLICWSYFIGFLFRFLSLSPSHPFHWCVDVFVIAIQFYSSSFNSAGKSDFGCLFSKCCLYVFGSGIWDYSGIQWESNIIVINFWRTKFQCSIIHHCDAYLANGALDHQSFLGCFFLFEGTMALLFLRFCGLFKRFCLRLSLLMSASHFSWNSKIWNLDSFSCNRKPNEQFSSLFSMSTDFPANIWNVTTY